MMYRWTMLFSQTTAPEGPSARRTAGWSESLYHASLSSFTEFIRRAAAPRARFLVAGASIVGLRRQQLDPLGPAQVATTGINGANISSAADPESSQDYPSLALYFRMPGNSATASPRPMMLRGIPDGSIRGGEWYPGVILSGQPRQDTLLNTYLQSLIQGGFGYRYKNPPFTVNVFEISTTGVVTTVGAHGRAIGDIVRPYQVRDQNGRGVQGTFRVSAIGGSQELTLQNWDPARFVEAGGSGQLRGTSFAFVVFDAIPENLYALGIKTISRKPGRPFGAFRGRAGRRS